ncbi:MAG: threonine/serine exporter family protein [Treponema sp.]|nr:threonine/serine exporter family protein [Candidatus Treponema caballi]
MDIRAEDMIDIAMRAGTLVLQNGGETYRTEATVDGIARSLGAKTASSFVTPTVIQFSYTDENDHYHSAIRRIKTRGVNLRKIALIDELTRRIEHRQRKGASASKAGARPVDAVQIERVLKRIDSAPTYPVWVMLLMSGLSSLCFAFMFGGCVAEALTAFVIGLLLRAFLILSSRSHPGDFLSSLLSGAFISILTELAFVASLVPATETVLIAVLMQVVPGLAITNAIRDIIEGDLVSGNARLVEAFMIAAGLSVGSVLGLVLFTGGRPCLESVLLPSFADNLILACVWAAGASGFSAFYLNTKPFDSIWGAVTGAAGWLAFRLTGGTGAGGSAVSYLAGALAVAAFSEVMRLIRHTPATVFLIPGLLPLVPGGGMFKTMRAAVQGLSSEALSLLYTTLLAAGAIALGIALVSGVVKLFRRRP